MLCPRFEDRDINASAFPEHFDFEIRLHVLGRDSVFVDDGSGNPLSNLFLITIFDRFPGYVIEDLTFVYCVTARRYFWANHFFVLQGAFLIHDPCPFRRSRLN